MFISAEQFMYIVKHWPLGGINIQADVEGTFYFKRIKRDFLSCKERLAIPGKLSREREGNSV